MYKAFKNIFLILSGFLLSSQVISGKVKKTGVPYVKNFSKNEYLADNQNWDIAQNNQGILYFANNKGLLEFDGTKWKTYHVHNDLVVRSINIKEDKIFVGAYNEFGYFSPDKQGKLIYHSLSKRIFKKNENFGEIWKIFCTSKGSFFQSLSTIIYYQNDSVNSIQTKEFYTSFFVNDVFYFHEKEKGLFRFDGENKRRISGSEILNKYEIRSILPFTESALLIGTKKNGLYIFDGRKFIRWNTQASIHLEENQIFSSVKIDENSFAFGTVQDGIVICNNEGIILQHINTQTGLQNNTVLSLFLDAEKNLWAGLDRGIDLLKINSPFSIFAARKKLGTAYTSITYEGNIYLGTNQGLYSAKDNILPYNFKLIDNTGGQVWSLSAINGILLCGHNDGAFVIKKETAKQFEKNTGVWKFMTIKDMPHYLIGGTYNGLHLYELNNGDVKFKTKIKGFDESCRILEWEKPRKLWVTHGYKGVFRLQLNEELDSCAEVMYYDESAGLPSKFDVSVFKVFDKLAFTTRNGIYSFNEKKKKFEKHSILNQYLQGKVNLLKTDANDNIWYIEDGQPGILIRQIDGTFNKFSAFFAELKNKLPYSFEYIGLMGEEMIMFGTDDGFIQYNPSANRKLEDIPVLPPFITSVKINAADSIIYFGHFQKNNEEKNIELPHKYNSITFTFSSTVFSSVGKVKYQYFLEDFDEKRSEWLNHNYKEYTNLPHGNYVFSIRSKDTKGKILESEKFYFSILPPWYLNSWAYLTYLLLFVLLILFISQIVKKRMQVQKRKILVHKEREILMKEREFSKLKNEKLQSEIKFKNKELGTTTMHLIQQKNLLKEIKNELVTFKEHTTEIKLQQKLHHLIRIINNNLKQENDWEQFLLLFDEVYEGFFKKIRNIHPSLTPKEQRLCAYLRMNLSTKEIALLNNVSIRGLEISRYRLRKKLNLERKDNLTDYILSI